MLERTSDRTTFFIFGSMFTVTLIAMGLALIMGVSTYDGQRGDQCWLATLSIIGLVLLWKKRRAFGV